MRSMTFLVNDSSIGSMGAPAVSVTITENGDGTLSFSIACVGGTIGDLRGFFFDVANETRIGSLSVIAITPGFTEFQQGDDSIKNLGNGANMQGLLGGDGGYDAGIEIGTAGTNDDYQSFTFILQSSAGALTLDDFANVDIGVRLNSLGLAGADRDGDVKLLEHTTSAIDAKDDTAALTEDAAANQVTGNVFTNDLNVQPAHMITAVNGSAGNIGDEIQGTYGTLRLNLDGSYTYTLDNSRAATQALAAGQEVIESFTYGAKSFDELTSASSDSASILITITGAADDVAPVITAAVAAGSVTEIADLAPGESVQPHVASGSVDFIDANLTDTHTLAVAAIGTGYLGSFSAVINNAANGDGVGQVTWTFEGLDSLVEHLGAGEQLTQGYILTIDDGHGGAASQPVTITITGANDAPMGLVLTKGGAVTEDAVLDASGFIGFTDLDLADSHAVSATPSAAGYLGAFSAALTDPSTGDGAGEVDWTFSVSNAALQHLGQDESVVQSYEIAIDDGHGGVLTQQKLAITLNGANDAPEIVGGETSGQVFEDGSRRDSGQLVATDVDQHSTLTWSATGAGPNTLRADYRFLVDALTIKNGSATFFSDEFTNGNPPPAWPTVGLGQTPPPGTPNPGYFTSGTFSEANGRALMDSSVGIPGPVTPPGTPGVIVHSATLNTDAGSDSNQGLKRGANFTVEARYDLVLPDTAVQNYGVRLTDGSNDIIDVNLRRMEDGSLAVVLRESDSSLSLPTIIDSFLLTPAAGDNQIVLRLGHAANTDFVTGSFDVLSGGTITQSHTFTPAVSPDIFTGEVWTRAQLLSASVAELQNGVYGSLTVDADGKWHYALNNSGVNVQQLAQGEHVTDTFNVKVTDEHGASDTQTVSVDVAGSNDAPVISNASTSFGSAIEDFTTLTGGQIIASDADHGATLHWTVSHATPAAVPGGLAGYSAFFHYTLDQLTVSKNGGVIFDDTFSDGIAPPSAPSFNGFPFSYITAGGHSEFGGRLHLDGTVAASQRGVANPDLTVGQFTILATNIDPNDLTRGLKSDDDFVVEARYDLAMPPSGGAYGITLSDNTTGGLPQDRLGDSNMSLLVRGTATGQVVVQLADFDVVTDEGSVLQSILLDPLLSDSQIVLRVSHDANQLGVIHAEFDLMGAGGTRTFAFNDVAHVFGAATPGYAGDDENWTRVQLVTFGPDFSTGDTLPGSYGTLQVQQDGHWNYEMTSQSLAQGQSAQDVFSVRVTDEFGISSFRPVLVNVSGTNDAPFTAGGLTNGDVVEDNETASFASGNVGFFDPDRIDIHTATFLPSPFNSTAMGTFSLGPVDEGVGPVSGSVGWAYSLNNHAAQSLAEGQTVYESYAVTLTDNWGAPAAQNVTVTITGTNDGPDAVDDHIEGAAGDEDHALTISSATLVANDTDVDTLDTRLIVSVSGTSTLGASVSLDQDGNVVYDPTQALQYLSEGQIASDTFTYTISDSHGATDTATVSLAVRGLNELGANTPPVAVPDTNAGDPVVEAGALPVSDPTSSGNLLANDIDPDSNPGLHITQVNGLAENVSAAVMGIYGALTVTPDGSWLYQLNNADPDTDALAQDASAFEHFTYTVVDSGGATSTADLTVVISGTNDAPVAGDDSVGLISKNSLPILIDVVANDYDVDDGDTVSLVTVISGRSTLGAVVGTSITEPGKVVYNPSTLPVIPVGHTVTDTFTYLVRDSFGRTDTATVSVVVQSDPFPNTAPIGVPDTNAGDPVVEAGVFPGDPSASGNLLANDIDPDPFGGLRLATVNSSPVGAGGPTSVVLGIYGSLRVDSIHGDWTYILDDEDPDTNALAAGQTAVDRFTYGVFDGQAAHGQSVLTVSIMGSNDSPVAVDDVVAEAVTEDQSVTMDVLANDRDVDTGDTLHVGSFGSSTGNALSVLGAALKVNADGTLQYDPRTSSLLQTLDAGESLTDTFVYTALDQNGASSLATVSVVVQGADDAPAVPADGSVFEDGSRHASGKLLLEGPEQVVGVTGSGVGTMRADYRFLLDNLSITRAGLPTISDDFGNGAPPPAGTPVQPNAPSISYGTLGVFAEGNGRLIMDGSVGAVSAAALPPGVPGVIVNLATLNTDTGPDATLGLKRSQQFTVEARYDLVLPDEVLESYGLRLNDFRDDSIEIGVRRVDSSTVAVVLRESDTPGALLITVEQAALLTAPPGSQIALRLTHSADADFVTASFDVYNGIGPTAPIIQSGIFLATPDIFTGENWTQPQIIGFGPATPQNGVYGTLSVDADGAWSYALANGAPNVQALAQGEHVMDTFNVSVSDGLGGHSTKTVSVDVVGSDDAPTNVSAPLSAISGAYVVEDGVQQIVNGVAIGLDVDHGAGLQWSVTRNSNPPGVTPIAYRANYIVRLDDLSITKNDAPFFSDNFNDGIAPTAFVGGAPSGFGYLAGGLFSESGGRAVLDGSLANAQRGAAIDTLMAGHMLTVASNIDPTDLVRGLKNDDDFTVSARFDLFLPGENGQSYGVSFTDSTTAGLPPDQLGDDLIAVELVRDFSGNTRVRFVERDVSADTVRELGSTPFSALAGEDQIVFQLAHSLSDVGAVHASFDVLNHGVLSRHIELTGTGYIFGTDTPGYAGDDEDWTRVQVIASSPDTGGTSVHGTYGTLGIDAASGAWMYTLDNASPAVQALAHGFATSDSFNVRVTDEYGVSTSRPYNFTVVGTGDPESTEPIFSFGGPGNDVLVGSNQADTFLGSAGTDLIVGRDGADTFDYNNLSDGGDTISDFTPGVGGDRLDLHDLLLALGSFLPGSSNPADFVRVIGANNQDMGPSTFVMVDRDGAGGNPDTLGVAILHGTTGVTYDSLLDNGNLIV
jgi:VCBS repeat-containing protein